ncbi:LutB/LldF family L-lactate oxidation iron-sulfur protein [Thermaerobacter subterraneus]|uniref:(4Fe-4S) cluster-containing protein n=1 Tax=Thermaerobacter subterraneus DSM 13965 TaxID=867903 RepID=K6P2U4_9FIRM|nr:LutB/LldF family L-lactate oxidation iron-sulfur protein [Thermaerobacter subterraneus]EKP95390.1 (4Fe-4S) cluster-containing protein [Thermaerobacter subterraneus DSM 13965]
MHSVPSDCHQAGTAPATATAGRLGNTLGRAGGPASATPSPTLSIATQPPSLSHRPPAEPFQERAAAALRDDFLRVAVPRATYRQHYGREQALAQLGDPLKWRERARTIRARTIAQLDRYLDQAVAAVQARGGHVHRAATAGEAVEAILGIIQRAGARRVVKSKSMVTEEIHLNPHLEAAGVEVVETDLGEYIIQLAGHRPSHIVAPAVHLSQQQIREIFSREAGRPLPDDAVALAAFARQQLRQKFLRADVGISGVNFLVAESGTVVLVTNEGNGRMVTSLPRIHIAVMGMERVVPTWSDLAVLLEVLARSATGQKITVYTTFVGGPRRPGEADGPEEFHLVIVDNGRSNLLGTRFQVALHCIRCGACLNACPVYRQIGGHPYGGVYSGPIGAVITPLLGGLDGWDDLPYASSLCGACHEACPVMIPLHDLLLDLREEVVNRGRSGQAPTGNDDATAAGTKGLRDHGERWAFRLWRWVFSDPRRYRLAARLAAWVQVPWLDAESHTRDEPAAGLMVGAVLRGGPGPLGAWTASRDFPAVASRPFHARWAALAREVDPGPAGSQDAEPGGNRGPSLTPASAEAGPPARDAAAIQPQTAPTIRSQGTAEALSHPRSGTRFDDGSRPENGSGEGSEAGGEPRTPGRAMARCLAPAAPASTPSPVVASGPTAGLPRADHPGPDPSGWPERFGRELEAVHGTWTRVQGGTPEAVAAACAAACAAFVRSRSLRRVVAWDPAAPDLPEGAGPVLEAVLHALEEAGCRLTRWRDQQPGFSPLRLREAVAIADLGIVVAHFAIVATGTVAVVHGAGRGRAVSLLPEHLVILVPGAVLVPTLAEAITGLTGRYGVADPTTAPQNVTFITGPSKSSDIELHPVVGVHGPRHVHAVIYGTQ